VEHERAHGYYKDTISARFEVEKSPLRYQLKDVMNCRRAHFDFQIEIATELSRIAGALFAEADELCTLRAERPCCRIARLCADFTQTCAHFLHAVAERSEVEACIELAYAVMKNFGLTKLKWKTSSGLEIRASGKYPGSPRRLGHMHPISRPSHDGAPETFPIEMGVAEGAFFLRRRE